jgi:alginate O-acetyltransferase complex protein AlgI
MEFNSLSFLFFFALVFLVYWRVPQKLQWLWLLITSYFFYSSWRPAYAGVIFLTTLITYLASLGMEKIPQRKKLILVMAVLADLGILFVFKYLNFFNLSINQVFSSFAIGVQLPVFEWLLPLGISFYTFQTVGYLVDVYRGHLKAEKNLGVMALFVLFFPKLIAGPIERGKHLLTQLRQGHSFEYQRTVSGMKLFAFGLFKKVVVADNLAIIVNRVFEALPEYKGLSLILTMILYSWQIYADFSGYTDMARGVARMLGYDLLENFNTPYLATSIGDFWRRWHMSLSSWLKDYLYIPLGGNRKGLIRTCINYLIVFTVCGIWHGAAWNFIIWGVFHGLFVAGEKVASSLTKGKFLVPRFISIIYTYTVVCVSWVFFRATTLGDAFYILRNSVVGVKNFVLPNYIWATISKLFVTNRLEMAIGLFCLGAIVTLELVSAYRPIGKLISNQKPVVRFSLYTAVVVLIVLFRNVGVTEFIYVQF